MAGTLQEGIYHRKKPEIGKSFLLLFLRINSGYNANEVGKTLSDLWLTYLDLREGITHDISVDKKHRYSGRLSVLIGYGPGTFDLNGIKRKKPLDLDDRWLFLHPHSNGGGLVLEGSNIYYASNVRQNHGLSDQIVVQFIAENEFYTYRALVETWKKLERSKKQNWGREAIRISTFYTGFQRVDQRNWLGFHDGISNMKSSERNSAICINQRYLRPEDRWLANGTYLAFLRMSIDLARWDVIPREYQELMIGREKVTGCPIIGVNNSGKPIKDRRCPVPGTSEVIDRGNERFRERPPYGSNVKGKMSERILRDSHMGQMRPQEHVPTWNKNSSRLFRQGFEFLENVNEYPNFRVGLNFVSFQNTPERLYKTLTYAFRSTDPNTLKLKNPQPSQIPTLGNFTSVYSAGIFLVPPLITAEHFPGEDIFAETKIIPSALRYRRLNRIQRF